MPDESAERSEQWYLYGFTDLALKERLLRDPDLLADLDAATTAIAAGRPLAMRSTRMRRPAGVSLALRCT